MLYGLLYRLLLVRIDAETAHASASRALHGLCAIPGLRALLQRLLAPHGARLHVRALGLDFPTPLGLAAGFDKDASSFEQLTALGFGFVEVGTVTAHAQPGNPRPRIFRLTRERALLNRMGFPNPGADAVAARLRQSRGPTPPILGVNVGKTKLAPLEDAAADYRASVRALAPFADYLVLNVSSPNTPGLRDLQSVERLAELVAAVRNELGDGDRRTPLLVKIAPDLADAEIDAVAALALELRLDGIVAVNTTVSGGPAHGLGPGGVSGAPLKARALDVLRRLHARTRGELTLVSVGGIETAEDVLERIRAGASLVQAYTGFVYGGPLWPRRINRGLARLIRDAGVDSIEQLIGSGAAP